MRATVIKILVFGAFFKNLCHAQTYRSQIRYLEENGDGGHQENQVEPVELKTIRTFDQPVVVPQVLNLPMFRYRLLPNPYLYPRDSLQPRSQYASYPTYTAYYNPSTVLDQKPQVDPNPRQPRLEDTEDSLQFKYRLIPPPPVDQVITPAPTPTPLKVYSYSPTMPPNTNVVNSLPPLKKPEYLGGFIQPPAALHSYHQYPGYFPEPYIIEKKAEVSAGKLRLEPQKKKTGHTIKKTQPGFPKQPRTVVPPPDIEHVAPPAMPPPQKENQRNGKSFSKLETEEEATTTSSTTTEATKPTFATASVKVNHIKAANEEEVAEVNLPSSIKAIEEAETPKPSLPVEFARGPKFTSFDVKIDERKPRKTGSILAPLPPVNEIIRPLLNIKEEDKDQQPYGYEYKVNHEGHAYGHRETTSNGRTEGQYQVVLPDGRVQTVKYYADNSGFHPQIIYTQ